MLCIAKNFSFTHLRSVNAHLLRQMKVCTKASIGRPSVELTLHKTIATSVANTGQHTFVRRSVRLQEAVVRHYCYRIAIFVKHDEEASLFYVDFKEHGRAYLEYDRNDNLITIHHTVVPESLEGRGLGKILAKSALEYVERNSFDCDITCEFVRYFVTKYEPKYMKYIRN